MAKITLYSNRAEYCRRNHYELKIKTDGWHMPAAHPVSWDRLKFMRDLLASGRYAYAWCAGADLMITNLTVRIEDRLIPKTAHVWAAPDWVAPIQADSFIVRASKEGIAWVEHILSLYETYKRHPWVENQAMIDTLPQYQASGVVSILPQHMMNSYPYRLFTTMYPKSGVEKAKDFNGQRGNWEKGDWVIHVPSLPVHVRIAEFKRLKPLIIR